MSVDLKDFRCKITPLTWCCIEARHRATGKDHSEIARDVLDQWSRTERYAAIEQRKLLEAEGIAGNGREERGTAADALRQRAEREID